MTTQSQNRNVPANGEPSPEQARREREEIEARRAEKERVVISRLRALLPSTVDKERFAGFAMAVLSDPAIADCTEASKMLCLKGCAQLGLFPQKELGHVYLVPFKSNRPVKDENGRFVMENGRKVFEEVKEVQLIPGYQGYIELARRSGQIGPVTTKIVYEADEWEPPEWVNGELRWRYKPGPINHREVEEGRWVLVPRPAPRHGEYKFMRWDEIANLPAYDYKNPARPFLTDLDVGRGRPVGVWCYAPLLSGGGDLTEPEWMDIDDVLRTWARSKARWNGPWVTDHKPMIRKSAVRRARKYWPQSPELAALAKYDDEDSNVVEGEVIPRQQQLKALANNPSSTLDDLVDSASDDMQTEPRPQRETVPASTGKPKGKKAPKQTKAEESEESDQGGVIAQFRQKLALATTVAEVDDLQQQHASKLTDPGDYDMLCDLGDERRDELK